ncbi:MAG TPA: acyl carrier protein [Thermoanaerobaculia bacterium]|nr:acyl carrier protein [Thermoanaerobaculia bacterium]
MKNREKLQNLLLDVFLLNPQELRLDLRREDVDTWDSLGVVSLAVGVHETFGFHMTPEEATALRGVGDLIALLRTKGIHLDAEA